MTDLYERLQRTTAVLAERTGCERHDVVVVLGSGLGAYPDRIGDTSCSTPTPACGPAGRWRCRTGTCPDSRSPPQSGHAGTAYSAQMGDNRVLLLSGRAHAYEGHDPEAITFAVRTAITAGCRVVVLTNAAGCCGKGMAAGDLAVITDHVNLAGVSVLSGPNDERLGPRFTDMTDVYTPELRRKAHAAAARLGQQLREGVYFWFHGPMFETPAEIRMAKALGGSMVGMSTVPVHRARGHRSPPHGRTGAGHIAVHQPGRRHFRPAAVTHRGDRDRSRRLRALQRPLRRTPPDAVGAALTTNLVDISSKLVFHWCDPSARARSRPERSSTGQNSNFLPDWTLRNTPRTSRPSRSVRAD